MPIMPTMPTMKEVRDAAWKPLLLAAVGGMSTIATGVWQDTKVSHAFYAEIKPEEVSVTLVQVQEFMVEQRRLGEEYGQMKSFFNTRQGQCRVYDTDARMTALVNRRSPWKKQDKLIVTDMNGEEHRSISVVVVGDFNEPTETYWIQVSPDAGRALNISPGKSIRVEVKPEK